MTFDPNNPEIDDPEPRDVTEMKVSTRTPEKYLLLDTETGQVWKGSDQGFMRQATTPLPKLTERQIEAFKKLAVEAWDDWQIRINGYFDWELEFKEEVRPGRGHDVQAFYFDTDQQMFLNVWMDVYGNHSGMAVASFEWIHNPSDDDCTCHVCAKQRADDEPWDIDPTVAEELHRKALERPQATLADVAELLSQVADVRPTRDVNLPEEDVT